MTTEKTTAIVLTEFECEVIRRMSLGWDYKYKDADELYKSLDCMKDIYSKILLEQCSGATPAAAEEHLNAR